MKNILHFGKKQRLFVALSMSVIFAVFSILPVETAGAFSISDEKELGRKTLEKIRAVFPLVEDGEVLTYVQSVGNRVAKQVGTTSYKYQFFIVDQSVPNAFAIPGGYIFIYRGLIEMMATEGELASIFCHEMAHIQAQHIKRQMEEGRVLNVAALAGMLAGILLGSMTGTGPALAMGSLGAAQSAALKYSRENEAEADELGFRYFVDAGYNPKEMANVMKKMSQARWMVSAKVPTYLSTHPDLGERVQHLEDLAQKEKNSEKRQEYSKSLGDFPIMQAALVADHTDPPKALERFQAGARKGDVASVFGLGRFYLRQGDCDAAVVKLQEAARLRSTSPFVLSTLGQVYHQQGKLKEAQKVYESALLLDPSASIVHFRLALVLQEMGQTEAALDHLQEIQELAPMFPEVDYRLGVILGQVNRLGPAHLHLGRYYEQKQDWKLAVYHYQKAKSLLKDSPQTLDEIGRTLKELEKRLKESQVPKTSNSQTRRPF